MNRAALVAVVVLAACGGDDEEGTLETYDVMLVAGADESFEERWTLDCDDDACTLGRPDGGAVLGDVGELRLTAVEDLDDTWSGEATGVRPVDGECDGTWTVQVEVSTEDDLLYGSAFRVPEADCEGSDLTLGLSGTRAG